MDRVNRMEFLQKLESVRGGLTTKAVLDQSNCFVFRRGRIITFNDEVACSVRSGLGKELSGAANSAKLLAILQKLIDDEVGIEFKESALVVYDKKGETEVRMDAEITLPIDAIERPEEWNPIPDEFAEAVETVQECAGKDAEKFSTTCIHIHPNWIEAFDNYQVCRYPLETGLKSPVLVRRDSIKHIVALGMSEFGESKSWIHFRNDSGLVYSCRYFVEKFFDVTPLLKFDKGVNVTLPKSLGEACERAEIFSGDNVDKNYVTVDLRPGKMRIRGESMSGKRTERERLNYDGPAMSFKMSPKLLARITQKYNECSINIPKLKIDGNGKFTYVTVLSKIEDDSD